MAQKRAGRIVKVSVSLEKQDLETLKRHAKVSWGGNLSAAFSEAAKLIRQREARRGLVGKLGGPSLTSAPESAIAAEQAGGARYKLKRSKRRTVV